ncbi:alpha/beta hydrolase [Nocardia cyriacigeorgica]|uniref:Alpha/beta hydrolase n=1 Tax=Nocardia cyriacigeorgica TaxID=135487 RepID=A0A6P1D7Z0_9NOCA|nr:alpha/beta hydrolase [Nocardia cyriacigeorgica]NEW37353.1 alpha/beta hydrolase [Nocardia cyriacigeorgica]NEW46786.1 alpha/beta hydrolase [Nocardia cyriacigeorgica]NEW50551.1 alpha/beta hydrolase [Nocardia cyriacigeorgica]NEW57703.1 alpha/beta hydrolase [Nocardia cyriacigeorgica]
MSESSPTRTPADTTIHGVHVALDGNPAAPPLLLIHGSGATGSTWAPVVPSLAAEYRVITIDLPGCGRSAPASTYTVAQQADRTAAVLDELGVRNLTVVGHSSGGYVATSLIERRPDLVGDLVLVSTGPSHAALLPEPAILRILASPPFGPLVWAIRTESMIRRALAATAAVPITVPDRAVADMRRTSYRAFRAILAAYRDYLAERTVPQRLIDTGKPLLAIFGDSDPRWDPASAHQYEEVPGAELTYLRGVGHMAMLEDGDALARMILHRAP